MTSTLTALPELRDADGRVVLPASELQPAPATPSDPAIRQRLIDKGLLDPAPGRLVTPRTGQVYDPEAWARDHIHWHGRLSTRDPNDSNTAETRAWDAKETPLLTPLDALRWYLDQVSRHGARVPGDYRTAAQLDQLLDPTSDRFRWHVEHDWVRLCSGHSIGAGLRMAAKLTQEIHVQAFTPDQCAKHTPARSHAIDGAS